jgi:hypothetical protein
MLILRSQNCISTASGIVTLCERPYSAPVESGLQSALNRCTILHMVLMAMLPPSHEYHTKILSDFNKVQVTP